MKDLLTDAIKELIANNRRGIVTITFSFNSETDLNVCSINLVGINVVSYAATTVWSAFNGARKAFYAQMRDIYESRR